MKFERGFDYDPSYNPEIPNGDEKERSPESDVDLRFESEVFKDHERFENERDTDAALVRLRDTLSEDTDGIIRLNIPAYVYDVSENPFIGMGPRVIRTYEISRFLDVVFMHRFLFHDILVCGVRSREFVDERGRAAFIKHIRDTGGVGIRADEDDAPYDILAQKFSPYVTSDTTAAFFRLYHLLEPHSTARPHWPIDVWLIFDASAYDKVEGAIDFRRAYKLKDGYDRRASLLGVAQIN